MTLSVKHAAFVAEYVADPDRNPGRAYARVYRISDLSYAQPCGLRLLRRADVKAEITRQEAAAAEAAGITSDEVVRDITMIAKADPRGLFEIHRGACRYCYGRDHLYQRTPRELREAMATYLKEHPNDPGAVFFDHQGGPGFNATKQPHPDCPECWGRGELYEYIKDSRDWTPGAARLFAGVERTREGLKVKTRSQDRALNLAAQLHHLLRPEAEDTEGNVPPPSEIVYEAKDASKPGRKR
jgi:hypothetical protein